MSSPAGCAATASGRARSWCSDRDKYVFGVSADGATLTAALVGQLGLGEVEAAPLRVVRAG